MKLAQLEPVDIRSCWKNEESDFTPWLAREENIQVLAEALGLDIEVEDTEVPIGSFRADIVAKEAEVGDGRRVIIENQLSKTDHKHLGQLITYASGLEATIVVWVCTEVTEEHRQAIDWLNDVTTAGVAFFACEIELWRIGDSEPAPRFNVVARPNDWSKAVKGAPSPKSLSPTKRAHLDFWNGFKEFMSNSDTPLRLRTPRPQHWYALAVGRSKFSLSLTTNTQSRRIGCELYIRGPMAKRAFALLLEDREAIERVLGSLDWQELPEGQDCRVIQYRDGNSKEQSEWPEIHGWLKQTAEAFHRELGPRVKKLDLTEHAPQHDGTPPA